MWFCFQLIQLNQFDAVTSIRVIVVQKRKKEKSFFFLFFFEKRKKERKKAFAFRSGHSFACSQASIFKTWSWKNGKESNLKIKLGQISFDLLFHLNTCILLFLSKIQTNLIGKIPIEFSWCQASLVFLFLLLFLFSFWYSKLIKRFCFSFWFCLFSCSWSVAFDFFFDFVHKLSQFSFYSCSLWKSPFSFSISFTFLLLHFLFFQFFLIIFKVNQEHAF